MKVYLRRFVLFYKHVYAPYEYCIIDADFEMLFMINYIKQKDLPTLSFAFITKYIYIYIIVCTLIFFDYMHMSNIFFFLGVR